MKKHFAVATNPHVDDLIQEGRNMERLRFTRELHDGLAQELLGIRLQVFALEEICHSADQTAVIQQIHEKVFQAIATLQGIIKNRIPDEILNQRFDHVLQRKLKLHDTIDIKIEGGSSLVFQEEGIAIEILRIVQEFTRNTLKHANATRIEIMLRDVPQGIRVELRDNGTGFNMKEVTTGMGIRNIHFRLESISATYCFTSNEKKGTQLKLEAYEKRD